MKAARYLRDLGPQNSCQEVFHEHEILTIPALYITEVILLAVFKNKVKLEDYHQYTRNASLTCQAFFKRAQYFNNLTDHIKQDTVNTFRGKL
ncbi:hypothetical protein J6590_043683, partial [Homalodisca vitripennis]